jgi:SAM-dependent methyltransferase
LKFNAPVIGSLPISIIKCMLTIMMDIFFAFPLLPGFIDYLEIEFILDIGSGTGRAVKYICKKCTDIRILGIETVAKLREVACSSGVPASILLNGDGTNVQFEDSSVDMVCEFRMLHHVRYPEKVISEMLRVASKAIYISDCNIFGSGSLLSRSAKQFINGFGLWKACNLIKTGGKGYKISKGVGLAYSYSVFNNYRQIQSNCERVHVINIQGGGSTLITLLIMSFY